MKGDRENNKGSHSLLSIPLCAILCCLNEEWKKRGQWRGRTLEKDIPWRLWLSRSFKDSLLIELFTCKQQLTLSFSFSFSHPHGSRAYIHIICCYYTTAPHTGVHQNQAFGMNMYINSMLYCCQQFVPVCVCALLVCLVSRAWSGTSRAVNLTLWPACTPSS